MTVVNPDSIAGITSVTSSGTTLEFYDVNGNLLDVSANLTGELTVGTGATISSPGASIIDFETNGAERLRIGSSGQIGIAGANYGTSGQVLKSAGSSSSVAWGGATTINNNASTRFITATGSADTFDGEPNLTYNNNVVTFSSSSLLVDKGTNPTISAKETSGNKEVQLRANTTGGLLRTVGSYPLVLGTNQTERLRIDSGGALLVGTTSPFYGSGDMQHEIRKDNNRTYTAPLMSGHSHLLLNNSDTTTNAFCGIGIRAGSGDGSLGFVYTGSANAADFVINTDGGSNGVERLRIENGGDVRIGALNSGRLIIGHTASRVVAGGFASLQVQKNTSEGGHFIRTSNDNGAIVLALAKSRSSAGAVCQAGDKIGVLGWYPHDGTDCNHASAEIHAEVVSGIGANDVPGDLVFKTNGGTTTTTERLRVKSDGTIRIGTPSNHTKWVEFADSSRDDATEIRVNNGSNSDFEIVNNKSSAATKLYTNSAERLRITHNGKIGFNYAGTPPSEDVMICTDGQASAARVTLSHLHGGNRYGARIQSLAGSNQGFVIDGLFNSSYTERLRLDNNGTLFHGTSSTTYDSTPGIILSRYTDGSRNVTPGTLICSTTDIALIANLSDSNDGIVAVWRKGGSSKGNVQISGNSTSYNTSSDYRLKENNVAISDGITRLKLLKPYRFNWKSDPGKTIDGFFAHEVTPAVPEAVVGEKDAVPGDCGMGYQSMDHSKLVPLLTAALQEAVTKIETLETEVTALKSEAADDNDYESKIDKLIDYFKL